MWCTLHGCWTHIRTDGWHLERGPTKAIGLSPASKSKIRWKKGEGENIILRWCCIILWTLWQFTGSGWGLRFSTRKWMLYKLGTQENLATDIKPIWGPLEKWQPPRSAFSKLWTAFFLRKTSPCLNCIMLKFRNQKFWKQVPGNGSIFLELNTQPIEFFELFEFHWNSIPLTSHKDTIEITPQMPKVRF